MILSKGLFVFESKNYSGWIFGSENQKNWYQTLPKGRENSHKEHFYNPIMQNRSHIKYLKELLGEQVPMHSIIAFSDRCTLKSVQIKSTDISVVNRENVGTVVSEICSQVQTDLLSESDITDIYNKLYPYTQVDSIAKEQHIANVHRNLNLQSIKQTPQTNIPVAQGEKIPIPMTEQLQTETVTKSQNETLETKTDIEVTTEPKPQNITETTDLKCPKCNGNLVLRTATRGANVGNQFYGCSNYPKCRYIQDISNSE